MTIEDRLEQIRAAADTKAAVEEELAEYKDPRLMELFEKHKKAVINMVAAGMAMNLEFDVDPVELYREYKQSAARCGQK